MNRDTRLHEIICAMQSIILLVAIFMASVSSSQAKPDTKASKSSSSMFAGLWSGVDPVLGSSLSLSINCYEDTNICETTYAANPWNWTDFSCGGLGVVVQNYTLVVDGARGRSRLTAQKNGPIKCFDGTRLSGYPGLNEFVVEPNGSIVWYFLDAEVATFEKRLWRTSCN